MQLKEYSFHAKVLDDFIFPQILKIMHNDLEGPKLLLHIKFSKLIA